MRRKVLPTPVLGRVSGIGFRLPARGRDLAHADYCSGFVRAFSLTGGRLSRHVVLLESGACGPILALAVDGDGEILILTELGEIRRLRATLLPRPQ